MKVIIDLPEEIYTDIKNGYSSLHERDFKVIRAVAEGEPLKDWLLSFDTRSATECYTAVQELKKRVGI